ncbi:hypothetical protein EDD17DRAFT_1508107 [Pisolithus thermaeus]|nr:hypothetical protein EDD17DRAFT_1508107 [Pisolithus thermaeus]
MEDEITSAEIYDDIPMVIKTAVWGTLFPKFTGHENLHRVLFLGQGKDSMRMILFVRVNNNLYTYSNERLGAALTNICQGTPPPVPTRWDRGIMGPIGLVNTVEDIHKLYAQAYDEPEDLVTYINLWKKCKLEMNEVMNLTLQEWRPPAWASQKVHQKREALRDKERAQREEDALRGQLFQPRGGGHPSGRKTRGGIPKLPQEAPPLDAPVQDWVKFIQTYQNRYSSLDESSELSRMFPGVLGISKHLNDDKWEIGPPSAQMVQGFLLYKQLAPVPRRDHNQMVWFWELVCLLATRGHYRALLEWAEVSPHTRPQVPWEGTFSQMATMADVAAYLAANGITAHTANDTIVWAHRMGNEYIAIL